LGACGITNVATDLVVAVSDDMYETWPGATANPNLNPICGKTLTAFYGSKSVTATVVDRCGGCAFYDLDFSRGAFDQLASEDLGRIDITWEWN
ncbi:uncharacterized protein STEHIDRAFT_64756, partial [Stereum hirsutum FP-91666 SS1]|uniref:uncharacterized protein n=1 Tax=Stereum hirsutum (strain FP-91666) TaxID=721885 RepID=UPI000444992F